MLVVIVSVCMYYRALLVVYLLGLLVANKEQYGANEENGTAPSNAVRPSKVPVWPVGGNGVRVVQFRVEEGRIEDEGDDYGQDCTF